jgi:hypothetical protein
MKQGDIRTFEFDGAMYPHTSFLYKVATNVSMKSGIILRIK